MIHAIIQYEVRFRGAGAVLPGSGFGTGGVDRGVVRTRPAPGRETPYVPGAHVRGVVRDNVEQLVRLVLGDDALKTMVHQGDSMNPVKDDPVARLFVSGGDQRLVVFRDLLPAEGHPGVVATRARVSIDRRTGTQRGQRLFDHETWYAGREALTGKVEAWLEGDPEQVRTDLAFLVGGLRLVDALGAGRSAGLGRCEVTVTSVRVDGKEESPEELLRRLGSGGER